MTMSNSTSIDRSLLAIGVGQDQLCTNHDSYNLTPFTTHSKESQAHTTPSKAMHSAILNEFQTTWNETCWKSDSKY